jgi:hypothetical protein
MKTASSRIAMCLSLALCLVWGGCSDDNGTGSGGDVDDTSFSAEETFRFRLDLAGHEGLRLEGVSGSIAITDVAGSDSIVIAGVRRVRSESIEDAEDHLPLLEVSVQDLSDEVFVETDQPEQSHGRSYEVDYDIHLPAAMDLDVMTVNGEVVLSDVLGDALVDLVNGQIVGEITIGAGGTMAMTVVNGTIDLGIPKTTSAEFAASVLNGYITDSDLVFQDRQSTANSLTGTLGGGDGTISLVVTNGTINVAGLD